MLQGNGKAYLHLTCGSFILMKATINFLNPISKKVERKQEKRRLVVKERGINHPIRTFFSFGSPQTFYITSHLTALRSEEGRWGKHKKVRHETSTTAFSHLADL